MTETAPEPGFVRVACAACENPDVWLRCNACEKSDHFVLDATAARCTCGATYDHGHCTCGADVPFERLVFVPFEKGPMALADLEIAWGRVAVLAGVVVGTLGLGAYWILG